MLQPKRTKFRKAFKGRIHGKATSCVNLDFGAFGLKAQEGGGGRRRDRDREGGGGWTGDRPSADA